MKTIRWGMIGCGDVTERKSGPGFAKARHSELRAVMRRNGALAADYARRHGVARSHDDAAAIIEADDIDAIYIATLTDSHREYTLRCAAAGKPVYVEKPMGMDHGQCLDMVAACRSAGVPLWVGFYRRALPRFLAVRDLVADGAIGDVRLAVSYLTQRQPDAASFAGGAIPWRVNPALSGGGFFFEGLATPSTSSTSCSDRLSRCAGSVGTRPDAIAPKTSLRPRTASLPASTEAERGAIRRIPTAEYTELVGSTGRLRFSISAPVPIRLIRGDTAEEIPVPDPEHVHQPMIQSIVDELNGEGTCASTGESGARTAKVMDQIVAECRGRFA